MLGNREVQVWAAWLDVAPASLGRLHASLSPAEMERAARFHFERDRSRFVAAHGGLRLILSGCLHTQAVKVEFAYGAQGKPALGDALAKSGLHFSLAHSEDLVLVVVTRVGEVGVDVERMRPLPEATELAARFFSPREQATLQDLPTEEQQAGFFTLWTRREARLKGTGEGIGGALSRAGRGEPPGAEHWDVQDLSPAPGFAAAVAVPVSGAPLHCWRWVDASDG